MYQGDLKLRELHATVALTDTEAQIETDYHVENVGAARLALKLRAERQGVARVGLRDPLIARPVGRPVPRPLPQRPAPIAVDLAARARSVIEEAAVVPLYRGAARTFLYRPALFAEEAQVIDRVANYRVSITLPRGARRVIASSLPMASSQQTAAGLVCEFAARDVHPLPVLVKWTERDEDVELTCTSRSAQQGYIDVVLTVVNRGAAVRGLRVSQNWSALTVAAETTGSLTIARDNDKDPRVVYTADLDLAAGERRTLTYRVKTRAVAVTVPTADARVGGEIVAISPGAVTHRFPAPRPLPRTAFAVPAGWSFDYLHGGDHHIKEHGMWSHGFNYDVSRQRLSWMTGCVYADGNSDDAYRWSAHHLVLRFNPGYSHLVESAWLAKTGTPTEITATWQDDALKSFSQAVVIPAGWRFDFVPGDHHINVLRFEMATTGFDKATGRVNYKATVTYADKNFDDMYRYQYRAVVLGFNGALATRAFVGGGAAGARDFSHSVTDNSLKGYRRAIVVPIGWKFDYESEDHHINENDFRLTNVTYNPATGEVKWLAHLNFCDQNKDDKYVWSYQVAVIATNDGEAAELTRGPHNDDGGLASDTCSIALDTLMAPVTWKNEVMDGDETAVDSGGSSPARDLQCAASAAVNPGNAGSAGLFSLSDADDRTVVKAFANVALLEYATENGQDVGVFYAGPLRGDRYVEAVAWYVDRHMEYVADGGSWTGSQSAMRTLTESGSRGSKDFAGDCEDHAILRAALLRSLGFSQRCVYCADHHNGTDQGQETECHGDDKKAGGHTFNVVVYRGRYRIMDYGPMQARYWSEKRCWNQHVVDNLWNDHTGKHWSEQDTSPFGGTPLVNYPGNPSNPSPNWNWRTYFNDVTP